MFQRPHGTVYTSDETERWEGQTATLHVGNLDYLYFENVCVEICLRVLIFLVHIRDNFIFD